MALTVGVSSASAAITQSRKGTIECHSGRTTAVAPTIQSSNIVLWAPQFFVEENGAKKEAIGQWQFQWPGSGPWRFPSSGINAGAQDGPRQELFGSNFRVAVYNHLWDTVEKRWYGDWSDGVWFAVNQGTFYTGTVWCNP